MQQVHQVEIMGVQSHIVFWLLLFFFKIKAEAIVIQLDYLWIICQINLTTWVKGWVTPVSNECELLSHWFSLLFWKEGCLWWSWRSVGRGFAPNWTTWWISGSDTLMTLSMGSKVTSDCCVKYLLYACNEAEHLLPVSEASLRVLGEMERCTMSWSMCGCRADRWYWMGETCPPLHERWPPGIEIAWFVSSTGVDV